MYDTTVLVQRGAPRTTVTDPILDIPLTAVLVHIEFDTDVLTGSLNDQMSALPKVFITTYTGCYDIQHGDILIDNKYINPKRNALYQYQVYGRAECVMGHHMELMAEITDY